MKVWQNKTIHICILWICIVPPVLIYLVFNEWPPTMNWGYFTTILLFSFLSALFPMKVNGRLVHLVLWVTVPAFLFYGLAVELIASQLIIVTILLSNGKRHIKVFKLVLGSLLFFFISLLSAAAFHIVGGEVGMLDFWPLVLAVTIYQFTQRIIYAFFYTLYYKVNKNFQRTFLNQVFFETLFILLILPFTLTLYLLIHYLGVGAFFLLGIPLFFFVFVLRKYDDTEKINLALERASHIGHRLSHNTTVDGVRDDFVQSVAEVFKADYIYLYNHEEGWFEPLRIYENHTLKNGSTSQLILNDNIVTALIEEKKSFIYNTRTEWIDLAEGYSQPDMQSMFVIPIVRDQEVTGVLAVASKRKNTFKKYQLQIADILCSYFTVSLVRARSITQTIRQSERCGLTHLYNYQYLEERLTFEYNRFQQNNIDKLTVMMLDIDHFKNVNDTYGHESGNEVLIELAQLLEKYTPQNGIVGRYGGEEFIYILPNISKEAGLQLGNKIRKAIAAHRFTVTPNLRHTGKTFHVSITASIGVSSIPEDTEELKSIVRNADRALYLGAKQAGRNRVAGYVK